MGYAAEAITMDEIRMEAALLAQESLGVFERHNHGITAPRMAITTAIDFANGRLDVMADHEALERSRQWAAEAARNTEHLKAKAAALAVAATCEKTVNLDAVKRLVQTALD